MLNLSSIFQDAIDALLGRQVPVEVPPLPAVVYMMQRDVVNHYRQALLHYFTLSLSGSPYPEWSSSTKTEFEVLNFTIHNLLRYTSRLVHDNHRDRFGTSGGPDPLARLERIHEFQALSNVYTHSLCDMKILGRRIGIRVDLDHVLALTPFTRDLSETDVSDHSACLREARIDIRERMGLMQLQRDGLAEVEDLDRHNRTFADLCAGFYGKVAPTGPFDAMNESWWL